MYQWFAKWHRLLLHVIFTSAWVCSCWYGGGDQISFWICWLYLTRWKLLQMGFWPILEKVILIFNLYAISAFCFSLSRIFSTTFQITNYESNVYFVQEMVYSSCPSLTPTFLWIKWANEVRFFSHFRWNEWKMPHDFTFDLLHFPLCRGHL